MLCDLGLNLGIVDINHSFAVEPSLHMVALNAQAKGVPLAGFENVFLFFRNLHEPSAAIRLIYAGGVVTLGSHFALPTVNAGVRFAERVEEYARIAVGKLLKLECEVEIVVIVAGSQVAIFLVLAALAHKVTFVIYIPQFGAILVPTGEVFAVE